MTKAKLEQMIEVLKAAGVPECDILIHVDAILRSMGIDPETIVWK